MATKKGSTTAKQSSLFNFVKKSNKASLRTSSPSETNDEELSEKKSKFVWKSKSNSSKTWTPPFKGSNEKPLQIQRDTPNYKEGSPSILTRQTVPPNKLDNVIQLETPNHQSHDVFDSMDVDELNDFPSAFDKTPEKSNRSIRISATPSPKCKSESPQKKILKTPDKSSPSKSHRNTSETSNSLKDNDPLKNIRLDSRNNSEFLSI
ncbi:putative protein TPRXL [Hyposmocoma kahamanoa]|uniref:putative protein TPRXL n=1 Tax=Hyposmocoma kahamanoa TaxID=1477025 RepID=UPI000E6DA260|nr:putative protein TPRXL [Hyposmocoma kahamanoa]